MPSRSSTTVVVDRIACTGHGACHAASDYALQLDEWGYPVPTRLEVRPEVGKALVRLCPARALSLSTTPKQLARD